ncbi:hypothetical protein MHI57_24750 [Cytobacillus sp. FSL K6-0129]|uniref:hypothetical protein n=1 Tax=Cytobacillus sp. FSL K6-0129 TaxID=2921421 RepID=UPI0030F589A1
MAKITLSDGTILEGTVKELTQYAEMAAKMTKKIGSEQESSTDELITHNGVEYKLVDRKAQPGDVVVFTENTSCCFRNDVVYGPVNGQMEVRDKDGHYMDVYYSFYNRTTDTVKVYEPVGQAEQPLKVGDYAKVICEKHGHEFSIGDIVELVGDGHKPNFMALRVRDSEDWFVANEEIVRATDEEVSEAKAQAKWAKIGRKPNEFKKGDIVRVTDDLCASGLYEGFITEIATIEVGHHPLVIGPNEIHYYAEVELITPVESRFDRA